MLFKKQPRINKCLFCMAFATLSPKHPVLTFVFVTYFVVVVLTFNCKFLWLKVGGLMYTTESSKNRT